MLATQADKRASCAVRYWHLVHARLLSLCDAKLWKICKQAHLVLSHNGWAGFTCCGGLLRNPSLKLKKNIRRAVCQSVALYLRCVGPRFSSILCTVNVDISEESWSHGTSETRISMFEKAEKLHFKASFWINSSDRPHRVKDMHNRGVF